MLREASSTGRSSGRRAAGSWKKLLKLFAEQEEGLTPELYREIQELLLKKAKTEEKDLNLQMPEIIAFIRNECIRQKQISDSAPDDHKHDLEPLNRCFRDLIS